MRRLRQFWQYLTRPWLAGLLQQVMLCRAVVLAVALLGLAHLAGYSLMPCPFYGLTKLPCPGCGMTRAFVALSHGNWNSMMALHPFAPIFVVIGALMGLSSVVPSRWREIVVGVVQRFEQRTGIFALLLLSFALFGLLRMGFFFFMRPGATFPPGRILSQHRVTAVDRSADCKRSQRTPPL